MLDGIDVSHWNGRIDWRAVAKAGISFAYVKATEGRGCSTDELCDANLTDAWHAKVLTGVYHLWRPGSFTRAVDRLYCLQDDTEKGFDLPPAVDLEHRQTSSVEPKAVGESVLALLEAIQKELGWKALVYCSARSWEHVGLQYEIVRQASGLWLRKNGKSWPGTLNPWPTVTVHQWSSEVCLRGVEDDSIDGDQFNGSQTDLVDWALSARLKGND